MPYTMVVVEPTVAMPKKTTMQKSTGPSWAVFPSSCHLVMTGISWERVASVPCTITPPGRLAIHPFPRRNDLETGSPGRFGAWLCASVTSDSQVKQGKGAKPGVLIGLSLYHCGRVLSTENGAA